MKITVVIPMYNESKIIADTARTLSEYMGKNFDSYEIIFFDDGSLDNSRQCVEELELPNVRALGYEQNRGKGCAVRHAMLEAEGEIRVFTDADLAYGTDVIRQAYELMQNGEMDLLIGSRALGEDGYREYTLMRKIASATYKKILCTVGGFKLSDSQCGFKVFRAEAAEAIFSRCEVDRFAFDFEAILLAEKNGMKIGEMPVKIINHRESSVHLVRDSCRMIKDLVKIKKRIKKL